MKLTSLVFNTLLAVLLLSCGGSSKPSSQERGDTLQLSHAKNITIVRHDGYTSVHLADPWSNGKTLHTYLLVPSDAQMPENLPEGTVVRTPLTRSVIATSVHCSLAMSLHCDRRIAGVCDSRYINLQWVKDRIARGEMVDCGNASSPTIEKIIDLQPDAIFLSPFQNSGGYGRLEELGIPIVEVADYMETSALGRAEWVKFYGLLFGTEQEADSIFSTVESNYLTLRQQAKAAGKGRSLIIDKMLNSVWYMPGGQTTMGGILADANASYAWASDRHNASLSLTFEAVLDKAGDADVWLIRYNSKEEATLASLLTENEGYSQFRAFKTGEVYGCNSFYNTYYEDTSFRPDILLREFTLIAHPEIDGELRYFKKMK